MVLCFPSTPKKLLMTVACFVFGAALFAASVHLSYINIAPQQARTKAWNDFVKERLRKKYGKWRVQLIATCLIHHSLFSLCLSFGLDLKFWCWHFDHSIAWWINHGCNDCECEAMILMALTKHDVFFSYVKII